MAYQRQYSAFLAALSVLLVPAVADSFALTQQDGGCTANSFTTPSWLIQGIQFSDVSLSSTGPGTASFHVLNRATNVSVELVCPSSNETVNVGQGSDKSYGWRYCLARNETQAGAPLKGYIQLNGTAARLLINETWSCNDITPNKPIVFSAVGNTSLSLTCTNSKNRPEGCKSGANPPLLVKGSLLSPVKVTPSYVSGPTGHNIAGCTAASKPPSWELGGTQYNRRISHDKNGTATILSLSLQVTLINSITGYAAICSGFAAGSGPVRLSCQGQEPLRRSEKYNIKTYAVFEPMNGTLTVNETWFCDDTNPATPVSIQATGAAQLPFECTTFDGDSESSPVSVVYCSGDGDVTATGHVVSQGEVAPYSLSDPFSTPEGCTVSSIVSPRWWLSDFETVKTANSSGSIRFSIELQTSNQSTGYPEIVSQDTIQLTPLGGLTWYPCTLSSGDTPMAPSNCTFRYDTVRRLLSLNADWVCNDLNLADPVKFSGIMSTSVPGLSCTTEGTTTRCATAEGKTWTVDTDSVTWN